MNILQVNTTDVGGGAAKTAWKLLEAYQQRGHRSVLAVGFKRSCHPHVYKIPGARCSPSYANILWKIHGRLQPVEHRVTGIQALRDLLRTWAAGESLWARLRGRENFNFPESHKLLDIVSMKPDIVHCHNLHGGYFDLRFLIELSHHVPVVLTLHDAWLLSGHCAHSLTCERWRTGCGRCPDLSIYPSLLRDGTVANWQEKRRIFEQSRLFVVTPSRWLMNKVRQSILKPIESRVIPNGVDLSVFRPGSKAHARQQLNIPEQAEVLLYVGSSDPSDSFKDFGTLKSAFLRLPTMTRRQRWLICLGEKRPAETNDQNAILYHGYEMDESKVALYYQAADVYVHSAKVENFPYAVLEAMACGVPVVASAVGGIPEQIEDGETGFLVPPGDIEALARSLHLLLADDVLRARLSFQAAAKARSLFDLAAQVDTYLAWYLDILQHKDRLC